MAEKEKTSQLHVDRFPTWMKESAKEWAQKQTPPQNLSRITIMLYKAWIESGFTTPKIGEEVELESTADIEKRKKMEALQKQMTELQNS